MGRNAFNKSLDSKFARKVESDEAISYENNTAERVEPSFDEGICNDYSYQSDNLDGTREEGYFESTDDYSTTGKGTDFDINTDPEDIISEMEENKKDPTNRDEVMEWLQSNYKTE